MTKRLNKIQATEWTKITYQQRLNDMPDGQLERLIELTVMGEHGRLASPGDVLAFDALKSRRRPVYLAIRQWLKATARLDPAQQLTVA